MEISKACHIINDLRTVYAAVEGNPDDAKICVYDFYSLKPFVTMRIKAITWNSVQFPEDKLSVLASPADVARVFDVFQQLLSTPSSERCQQTKYTVHVFKNKKFGYLNIHHDDEQPLLDNERDTQRVQAAFSQEELEHLKQRDDVAIDWDKAIIKPVEDD